MTSTSTFAAPFGDVTTTNGDEFGLHLQNTHGPNEGSSTTIANYTYDGVGRRIRDHQQRQQELPEERRRVGLRAVRVGGRDDVRQRVQRREPLAQNVVVVARRLEAEAQRDMIPIGEWLAANQPPAGARSSGRR